jgi:alpha-1,3-rhamnosyl/mannosyltransferase
MSHTARILVNDRCLYRGGTGVSMYLRNILRAWPRGCPLQPAGFWSQHRRRTPRAASSGNAGLRPLPLRPLAELGSATKLAWRVPHWARRGAQKLYGAAFAAESRREAYAACFEPNNIAIASARPTITTVHDVSVLDHADWHPADRVAWWKADLAASLKTTVHWIATSAFTRDRMRESLGIARSRISVVRLAARPLRRFDHDELPAAKRALGLPQHYLLHLGTIEPRKNLPLLLDAYEALGTEFRRSVPLIFAGGAGWGAADFWRRLVHHPAAPHVMTAGYVRDAAAATLLAGADAVLVPSRYEGFGLPVLEAMACGAPVICSTADALREVAGDAADLLDCDDVAGWSAAMERAVQDGRWRSQRIAAGRRRAAAFSWQRAAEQTADVFCKCVEGAAWR